MSKAKTLAATVSTGGPLEDGAIGIAEVTGLQTVLDAKQDDLISGTNIKTVAGQSILGAGDINIAAGAYTLLSTITANNSATVDFENIDSTYDTYMVVGNNVRCAFGTTTNLRSRPKLSGSFSPSASAKYCTVATGRYGGTSDALNITTEGTGAYSQLTGNTIGGSEFTFGCSFVMMLYGPMNSESGAKMATFESVSRYQTADNAYMSGGTAYGTSNFSCGPMTGIRFYMGSGNIVSGDFRIYGIKKS